MFVLNDGKTNQYLPKVVHFIFKRYIWAVINSLNSMNGLIYGKNYILRNLLILYYREVRRNTIICR